VAEGLSAAAAALMLPPASHGPQSYFPAEHSTFYKAVAIIAFSNSSNSSNSSNTLVVNLLMGSLMKKERPRLQENDFTTIGCKFTTRG
jgi:hypothetical protein